MLHPDDIDYWAHIALLARLAGKHFDLDLRAVEPKRRPSTGEGLCYVDQRRISIAVRDKATADFGGEWASKRYPHVRVLDTVAHELAHLVYRDHGSNHQAFSASILGYLLEVDAGV